MNKRVVFAINAVLIILIIAAFLQQSTDYSEFVQEYTVESRPITIDRVFPSMQGPVDSQYFQFSGSEQAELIWLLGTKIDIVNQDNKIVSPEYLCHSNLNFNLNQKSLDDRNAMFGHTVTPWQKVMDLIQGQTAIDFPNGFGMPLLSNEPMFFHAMLLNNRLDEEPMDLRAKTTFRYIYDKQLSRDLKPLNQRIISLYVPISEHDGHMLHAGCGEGDKDAGGLMCAEGLETASMDDEMMFVKNGQTHSYHWMVPPGRHSYSYEIAKNWIVPFDTTVHVITMHAHAHAETMELWDKTENKLIFKGAIKNLPDGEGVDEMDSFVGEEGIPFFKDRIYELKVTYQNPTQEKIDAMAVMYLYYWDKHFDKSKIQLSTL